MSQNRSKHLLPFLAISLCMFNCKEKNPVSPNDTILYASVNGYILEKQKNTSVPNAIIILGNQIDTTDINGYFKFNKVSLGSQTIKIIDSLYHGIDTTITIKSQIDSLIFRVDPLLFSLKGMVYRLYMDCERITDSTTPPYFQIRTPVSATLKLDYAQTINSSTSNQTNYDFGNIPAGSHHMTIFAQNMRTIDTTIIVNKDGSGVAFPRGPYDIDLTPINPYCSPFVYPLAIGTTWTYDYNYYSSEHGRRSVSN